MSKEKQIGICITTKNRLDFTIESFAKVIDDERVGTIVISDDASDDDSFCELDKAFKDHRKVWLFENQETKGVYRNKRISVGVSPMKWVIVFDSDNVLDKSYIDKIFDLPDWDEKTFYCPDFAMPGIDYTHFAGETITKENAGKYIDQRNGGSLFNTMNFFCNKERYLDVWNGGVEPIAADSIQMNYLNLVNDGAMYVVPGLRYIHTIHPGSHYVNFTHKSDVYHKQITDKIRLMK